jgi:hypothetical protein
VQLKSLPWVQTRDMQEKRKQVKTLRGNMDPAGKTGQSSSAPNITDKNEKRNAEPDLLHTAPVESWAPMPHLKGYIKVPTYDFF